MSYFEVSNVKISGIVSCVPEKIVKVSDIDLFQSNIEYEKFVQVTGVSEKHHVTDAICTSDLCFQAANDLLINLNWSINDIEMLVFVSQTPDYIAPNTSIILQDRLGLPKSCICFDITLGCSGYV